MAVPSADRMHQYDSWLSALVLAHVGERISLPEAPLDFPGDADTLREALAGLIRPEGNPPAHVLELYREVLALTVISADSPRFLTFIPAAPTKASLLFDMVVSAASLQGISWLEAAGAVAAENQALRWIADLAGFPDSAGGTFVSGGSAANLSALAVARDTQRAKRSAAGQSLRPLRIAVSGQAHSSIKHTAGLLDLDLLVVPCPDHRFTGEALAAALASDADPSNVIAVVGTSGTTNAGIIDDLAGLSRVARERGLWFHVDGAYGGAGLAAPSVRDRYVGIENADSFIVDPHKWLFAPFDCAALLYRDSSLARAVHTQDASYLDSIHDSDAWNPTDYAYHLTRRARGLPLWFSLAVHGTKAYEDAVESGITLAQWTARRIDATDQLTLLREPELSVVLFRREGWQASDYQRWSDELLRQQIAFVTSTTWDGETVGRLAFVHPGTTTAMVDEILDAMR